VPIQILEPEIPRPERVRLPAPRPEPSAVPLAAGPSKPAAGLPSVAVPDLRLSDTRLALDAIRTAGAAVPATTLLARGVLEARRQEAGLARAFASLQQFLPSQDVFERLRPVALVRPGGGGQVNINALDAPSFERFMASGNGRRVMESLSLAGR